MNHLTLRIARNNITRLVLPLVAALVFTTELYSQSYDVHTRVVGNNLYVPWEITWGPDNWIWFTQRDGWIKRLRPETGEVREVLKVTDAHEMYEAGLLGMVHHPNFVDSPYIYVSYVYTEVSDTSETAFGRLERYTYNAKSDTLTDAFALIDSIPAGFIHMGGRLLLLPDQTLLMTLGERGEFPEDAQDHTKPNGKTLRISLDGTVPSDNPWPDNPWPSNLIWTTGHRNHQGLSVAPDGTVYSCEHGTDRDDEINILKPGRNYGWPRISGFCDNDPWPDEEEVCEDSSMVDPLYVWTPTVAPSSVLFYNANNISQWEGTLLMTTLKGASLHILTLSADGKKIIGEDTVLFQEYGRLRDMCVSPEGRLFLSTSNRDGGANWEYGFPKADDDKIIEVTFLSGVTKKVEENTPPKILPHPLHSEATLHFETSYRYGVIEIYDIAGNLKRREVFPGGDEYHIQRKGLVPGQYLMKLLEQGRTLASSWSFIVR